MREMVSRRGLIGGIGASLVTASLASLSHPEEALAETKIGQTTSATYSWYTGSATSRLDWTSGSYVTFSSLFSFSHFCQPESVRGSVWFTGGGTIPVDSRDFYNNYEGKKFKSSFTIYDVHNTDYGGMFNGKGSWHVPTCANFYLTTVQLSCSMYGLRSGGGNDRPEPINSRGRLLLPVIGASGDVGYAFEEDLQPFGGASKEEMAEMVAMGYRIVDVYDEDGLTVVDSFVVECAEMEVIE